MEYLVHTGPPTCTFNCHMGFDINCDDRLGDFCPAELDRNTVAGVKQCLADTAVTPAAAVPASVPAAQAVAATTSLAHTGSEASLAVLGGMMLGFGSAALGVRRRLQIRNA